MNEPSATLSETAPAPSDLDRYLKQASDLLDAAVAEWKESINDDVQTPLHNLLEEATGAHVSALSDLRAAEADEESVWQAIVDYRRAVHDNVLKPLLEHFRQQPPPSLLGEAHARFLQDGVLIQEALPEWIPLPDNPDSYPGNKRGGFGGWARSLFTRLRGQDETNEKVGGIPLRSLIGYHIGARLPLLYTPVYESLQSHYAQVGVEIERSISSWVRSMLVAERGIDTVAVRDYTEVRNLARANDDGDPDSPEDDGEQTSAEKAIAGARDTAEKLHASLDQLTAADISIPEVEASLVELADRRLRTDLADAQSRGGRIRGKSGSSVEGYAPADRARRTREMWEKWFAQVTDRLELGNQMLAMRRRLLETEESILGTVARKSVDPILTTTDEIEAELARFASETNNACEAAEGGGDIDTLYRDLRMTRLRAGRHFTRMLREMPGLVAADEALVQPGSGIWTAFLRSLDTLPETLTIHALPDPTASTVDPLARTKSVAFRDVVKRSLGPLGRRLEPGAAPLRSQLRTSWTRIEEVQNVVLFNLDAAVNEVGVIRDGDESEGADDASAAGGVEDSVRAASRARELSDVGLTRAVELLSDIRSTLGPPWGQFASATVEEVQSQWIAVLRRLRTDDDGQEQWEDRIAGLQRQAESYRRSVAASVQSGVTRLRNFGRRTLLKARKLVRLGQSAVGGPHGTEQDLTAAIDALSDVAQVRKSLPLIYRHLFSFEPLSEPTLHEGRRDDLDWMSAQYRHWITTGRAGAVIVSAPQGSGRTSFLTIAAQEAFPELGPSHFFKLDLDERLESEPAFARHLAAALNLSVDEYDSLSALESAIVETPELRGRVCLIDNLEHLVIRCAEGTTLIERVLLFFSRTDTAMFWVAATNDLTWRYIQSSVSGTASGFLNHRSLKRFSGASLKQVVLARHRRSGMQLRFLPPQTQTDAMRQWVRRRRSAEEQQAHYQDVFFERLARVSGQNIMLALYYWVSACQFEDESSTVVVSPVNPLSFDAISRQPLAWAFSLEHFLFHKTLTADEHARIARLNADENVLLLEALLNRRMIAPVRDETDQVRQSEFARIDTDTRYRIHPLLLFAVRRALEQRHIVY